MEIKRTFYDHFKTKFNSIFYNMNGRVVRSNKIGTTISGVSFYGIFRKLLHALAKLVLHFQFLKHFHLNQTEQYRLSLISVRIFFKVYSPSNIQFQFITFLFCCKTFKRHILLFPILSCCLPKHKETVETYSNMFEDHRLE